MKKLLLPLVLLAALRAGACINGETRELKDGTRLFADPGDEEDLPRPHDFRRIDYAAVTARLEAGWKRTGNPDYRSDIGVLLLLQQQYGAARDLYLALEKSNPGRYSTAANLGTVYELMGRNDSALLWIRRAVAINPKSHQGSEWIHVRILEAKVAGNSLPTGRALLGVDFGSAAIPDSNALRGTALYQLDAALRYQLSERMSFVPPPNPVLARLLFELANIRWVERRYYPAELLYRAAARYGFADTLLHQRRAALEAAVARLYGDSSVQHKALLLDTAQRPALLTNGMLRAPRHKGLIWAVGVGFLLLIGFMGFLLQRRSR